MMKHFNEKIIKGILWFTSYIYMPLALILCVLFALLAMGICFIIPLAPAVLLLYSGDFRWLLFYVIIIPLGYIWSRWGKKQ